MPHKDLQKRREYHKEYMRKNPQVLTVAQKEAKKAYMEKWSEENKEKLADYQKARELENKSRRLNRFKYGADKRNLDFRLDSDEFNKIIEQDCHYCGRERAWGVDRKNNKVGYVSYNVVPCCGICNLMKRDLNYEEFLGHVAKIVENFTPPE